MHLIGLIKQNEQQLGRGNNRQGWQAERINKRRNLGLRKEGRKNEERMKDTHSTRRQADARQTDIEKQWK